VIITEKETLLNLKALDKDSYKKIQLRFLSAINKIMVKIQPEFSFPGLLAVQYICALTFEAKAH